MKFLVQLLTSLLPVLLSKKQAPTPPPAPPKPTPVPMPEVEQEASPEPIKEEIDWSDPKAKISKYFTVNEALMLREWKRLANAEDGLTDEIKANIVKTAQKMDVIREFVGKPLLIKSWLRPPKYNVAIGGAAQSAHMDGLAVDWWTDENGDGHLDGQDCDQLKELLAPKLEEWEIRMENNGRGARWIHIDLRAVPAGGKRFFKP